MSLIRRFQSLVSFDGKWFIATCNLSTWASSSCVSQQLSCLLCWSSLTHFLSAPHVLCGEPMTASLFNSFITCFRATHLVHMRSEQRWRLKWKCSTATEQTQCASYLTFSPRENARHPQIETTKAISAVCE